MEEFAQGAENLIHKSLVRKEEKTIFAFSLSEPTKR
jgi:hypothetical protein